MVFGLVLSHLIVPHHHHSEDEQLAHKHEHGHDHDGERDHHHHLLDLFFSIFHHVDDGNSLYVHQTKEHYAVFHVDKTSAGLPFVCGKGIQLKPKPMISMRETASAVSVSSHSANFLRGPPLA